MSGPFIRIMVTLRTANHLKHQKNSSLKYKSRWTCRHDYGYECKARLEKIFFRFVCRDCPVQKQWKNDKNNKTKYLTYTVVSRCEFSHFFRRQKQIELQRQLIWFSDSPLCLQNFKTGQLEHTDIVYFCRLSLKIFWYSRMILWECQFNISLVSIGLSNLRCSNTAWITEINHDGPFA